MGPHRSWSPAGLGAAIDSSWRACHAASSTRASVIEMEAADMWRTILLAGVLPFGSAFLGGALAFSLVAAPQATAQSSQPQEVRASAFTLVGPDGTVLAQLAPTL